MTIPLIIISVVVAIVVLYFHLNMSKKNILQIPLAFIFGGTISNLFDRVFRLYVIDYINFRFWPVFNISDAMINIGVLVFIYLVVFKKAEGY